MNTPRAHVLMVDDEPSTLELVRLILEEGGYRVTTAETGEEALKRFRAEAADVVITDLHLPGMSGEELIPRIREAAPQVPVLVLTAYGTIESAVEMIKGGAYDYLKKPFEKEDLLIRVRKAVEHAEMARTIVSLRDRLRQAAEGELLGDSPELRAIRKQLETVAPSAYPVLITGESGTGKELVARTVHRMSRRRGKFVVVNCGAIPEQLFESEFFGYMKGAFTGASANKTGWVEEADGGTLFLDELGEITLAHQVKILRFLQDGEFQKVGATATQHADVRVVAATNRDLKAMVEAGTFREDLFYRVNVIPVHLPPLRERPADLLLLAQTFLARECEGLGKDFQGMKQPALDKMLAYPWPGNVRELENRCKWTALMFKGGRVDAADIYLENLDPAASVGPLTYKRAKEAFEKEYVTRLLRKHRGNISQAAREADKYRPEFYNLMRKYAINADTFRDG